MLQAWPLAGGRRKPRFGPHFPLGGMGDGNVATGTAPGQGHLLRRFKAGIRPQHLTLQQQRLGQGLKPPAQLQHAGAVALAAAIGEHQGGARPLEPQGSLTEVGRQGHPKLRGGGRHHRRGGHRAPDQGRGRTATDGKRAQEEQGRQGTESRLHAEAHQD